MVSSTTSPCVAAYTHTVLETMTRPASARRPASSTRATPKRVEGDALGRVGDDVVHVGHRREVEDRVRVLQRVGDGVLVEHVDVGPLDVRLRRRLRVDDPHVVARAEEGVDDVRADEARAAGDRDQFVAQC